MRENRGPYTEHTTWAHNLVVRVAALQSVIIERGLKITPQQWQEALQEAIGKFPLSTDPDNAVVLEDLVASSKQLLNRPPLV